MLERVNWDHSFLIKYVRTTDLLSDILTKGIFTTMQWNSFLTLWPIRALCESNDDRRFCRKPFSAFGKPQAMSQVRTQSENVDQVALWMVTGPGNS